MQRTLKTRAYHVLAALLGCLFLTVSYAATPVWTIIPDSNYPPTVSITPSGTATVKYVVTNQSSKPHTLVMQPIAGVTQVTTAGNCPSTFTLGYKQSCTLNLLINGNLLNGHVKGGPVICQSGSAMQCYQPAAASSLNITLIPLAKYLITPVAAAHGIITPNSPQTVLAGSNLTFTASPAAGYQVDQWLVDGGPAQRGGSTFTLLDIDTNHSVEATFTRHGTIYAGTDCGNLYFSTDNGVTWRATTTPSICSSVNSIFATPTTLYVGSDDGNIYYSTTNGVHWESTTPASGVGINAVFVTQAGNVVTLYAGTQDGRLFYSIDNGDHWTSTAADPGTGAINGLFVTATNTIYAANNDGNIYYTLNNGATWNTISGPLSSSLVPVQNIFVVGNSLYVNTRKTSSNSTLPPGTIDFEYAYSSNSLTDANPTWTLLSQITYTLFVNSDASLIYAGTQGGYVFSLSTGDELGFITYDPVTSLFFLG